MTDEATVTELTASYGWVTKKVIKKPMTCDPPGNLMNYVKFTLFLAASTPIRTEDFAQLCS